MSFAITGAAQEFQLSISRAPKQGDGMWCLSLVLSLVLDRHAAEQSLETFCCLQYSVPLTMPSYRCIHIVIYHTYACEHAHTIYNIHISYMYNYVYISIYIR